MSVSAAGQSRPSKPAIAPLDNSRLKRSVNKVKSFFEIIARLGQYIAYVLTGVFVIGAIYCAAMQLSLSLIAGSIAMAAVSLSCGILPRKAQSQADLKFPAETSTAFILKNKIFAADFRKVLTNEIFPLYIHHENTFDSAGIHGRMHISRCVIYTLAMLRFYKKYFNAKVDEKAALYTIAMHDAGRQGNGPDLWEGDSQKLAYNFLRKKGYSRSDAEKFSKIINKANKTDSCELVSVRSADCLDIMRPCCGHGGRGGFNEKWLKFLNAKDPNVGTLRPDKLKEVEKLRKALIEEIWGFIQLTEKKKDSLKTSNTYFEDILFVLESNQRNFPTLFKLLSE